MGNIKEDAREGKKRLENHVIGIGWIVALGSTKIRGANKTINSIWRKRCSFFVPTA